MFLFTAPVPEVLIPVVLLAVLHLASFTLTLLDWLGIRSMKFWPRRVLINLMALHARSIIKAVAATEVLLMPLTVFLVLTGRMSFVIPFFYYYFFLGSRYTDGRNPYTRIIFRELRVLLEQTASHRRMPLFGSNIIHRTIRIVSNLEPPSQDEFRN